MIPWDSRFLGHTIIPDLDAEISGSCSMFVEMYNVATKPSSCDDSSVDRLAISTNIVRLWSMLVSRF